ncbi:MAG: hypothetical protein Q9226_001918 [Calogaya cf. arnoldii]
MPWGSRPYSTTSSYTNGPLYAVFLSRDHDIPKPVYVFEDQQHAFQWCDIQLITDSIKRWSKTHVYNLWQPPIGAGTQSVKIVGLLKGVGVEMDYTIERCAYERNLSPALQAEFASKRETLKEVFALYDGTKVKVSCLCVNEEDAQGKYSEEICRVSDDPQTTQKLEIEGVPFADDAEGWRMLEEMEMG